MVENGRMEGQVKQTMTLGNMPNTLIVRKNMKKKHKDGLERTYKMKQTGLPMTREEIKESIKANNNKIKKYQSRSKTAPSKTIKGSFIGS